MLNKEQADRQLGSFKNFPDVERVKFHTWLVGTDYSFRMAMKAHRLHAKKSDFRAYHLREAMRLRAVLRSGVVYYFHVNGNSGKTFPLVPFVSVGSPLQYTAADAR